MNVSLIGVGILVIFQTGFSIVDLMFMVLSIQISLILTFDIFPLFLILNIPFVLARLIHLFFSLIVEQIIL